MLTLNDGRNELWQWDTKRKLTVDAECSQVHFSNKVFGRSIDVDVIDGIAIIPDILLQTDKDLTAWAFVGTAENGYTKISKTFKVNKRNKPADYVFTPPEQTSLEEIKEKLDYLESIQDPDAIKNAVEDYLDRNPVEAPVQSVNGKTGKIKLTAEDVGAISQDKLQEATNEALAQAKKSGEFNGEDGYTPIKGVDYFDGKDGQDGKDYVLTDDDLTEIAEQAAGLVEIPEGDGKAFIVTITESGDKYTADKIPSEIYAAHNSGVPVLASLMMGGGIATAYLTVAQYDAAVFQVPNFMLGEVQAGATVIIAGNEPEDRSVSVLETTIPDSGGNVAYDEAQKLTDEQKAQARENIGAQPVGSYLTEVPEGYAKTEDVPTDEEIIQLIKDNAPEPVGGIDLGVTGATVGQTVKISAVDENGVPTAWEPVDFPREEIADVQLATGTIANGTEAGTVIDTGISVKMLRNYKKFKIRVTGASNVSLENCYFRFTNSSGYVNIARVGSSGFLGYFTWFDQDKTLLTSENWEGNTSLSNLYPNLIIGNKTPIHNTAYYNTCKPHVFYDTSMLADDDTLKIVLSAATTIDYTLEIRGVTV